METNKTRYTLLGTILVLLFIQIIVPGNSFSNSYKYLTSLFLVPYLLFLIGGLISVEEYKNISIKNIIVKTIVILLGFIILNFIYHFVYYFAVYNFKDSIKELFNNFFNILKEPAFKSNYAIYLLFAFVTTYLLLNKFNFTKNNIRDTYFIVSIISIFILIVSKTLKLENTNNFMKYLELYIQPFYIFFFGYGLSKKDDIREKQSVEAKIKTSFITISLFLLLLFFKAFNSSDWNYNLNKNNKHFLLTLIRSIEMIVLIMFNVLSLRSINNLLSKNSISFKPIKYFGSFYNYILLLNGLIISIPFLIFKNNNIVILLSLLIYITIIIVCYFTKTSKIKQIEEYTNEKNT